MTVNQPHRASGLIHVSPAGPENPDALAAGSVVCGGLVHTTVIPRNEDGSIETGGIRGQSERIFATLENVLGRSGSSLANLIHLTIYLTDIADRDIFNEVYTQHVPRPFPSRCALQVSALAVVGMKVEVTAVAALTGDQDRPSVESPRLQHK
ncbi:RidA family protein [Arthrobacter sp. UYEF36]|uniref:RidA family protein n=1 Tax=Arthrobacter sp. UYEF36 TaxID=1756366 RepID=UPI00339A4D08